MSCQPIALTERVGQIDEYRCSLGAWPPADDFEYLVRYDEVAESVGAEHEQIAGDVAHTESYLFAYHRVKERWFVTTIFLFILFTKFIFVVCFNSSFCSRYVE